LVWLSMRQTQQNTKRPNISVDS